jgi:hypothetical protein
VTTVQFLKTCAKVEKVKHSNGAPRKGYTEQAAAQLEEHNANNIFRRGVMNFEDYNYENYNRHILVDPKTPFPEDEGIIEAEEATDSDPETEGLKTK